MQSSLDNLWRRRHLLRVLVVSNLKRQNKNSVLGYLWWLLDPLLMMGVYFVLVEVLFKRGRSDAPYLMFLLCGLLCWKAFADSVSQSVGVIRAQGSIIKSISFPKAVLPISIVLSNVIFMLFGLIIAVGQGLWYGSSYGTWPNVFYLMLPVVILFQVMFTLGISFLVATLGLFFQDTGNILGHVLRMWYFLSPGLYALEQVPERYRAVFRLNPFTELMESYREILIYGRMPSTFDLGLACGVGLGTLLVGYWVFKRYEGRFVQKL